MNKASTGPFKDNTSTSLSSLVYTEVGLPKFEVETVHSNGHILTWFLAVVIAGTNGEAVTLSLKEKADLVKLTRTIAKEQGRPDLPITLGCGGATTQAVIAETQLAAESGADFALVLVPSYFHFAMNQDAIVAFFEELADASPVPIVIYNFPGVVAGLDVNSEMLSKLGKHHNIVGVKLTCGGIAKVARIKAEFDPKEFCALAGQSDWLVPALSTGGTGVITGVANLFPKVRPGSISPGSILILAVRSVTDSAVTVLHPHLRPLHRRQGEGGVNSTTQARPDGMGLRKGRHQRDQVGGRQVTWLSRGKLPLPSAVSSIHGRQGPGLDVRDLRHSD
jgi:hypothetical protein